MVTVRGSLRALYSAAAIAGAVAGGGPAAGRFMASLLQTPQGKKIMDKAIDKTLEGQDVDTANFATGGFVNEPTLAMIGEAGPELVLPLGGGSFNLPNFQKKKRRASAYSRKYKKAFDKVAKDFKKKNGEWKKGGFKRAVKAAHAKAKKMK